MLNADDQKITLAGLSSVGIRLFLVTYDAQGLRAEQSIVVPQLPPASQVLADVMLSHWPISAGNRNSPLDGRFATTVTNANCVTPAANWSRKSPI